METRGICRNHKNLYSLALRRQMSLVRIQSGAPNSSIIYLKFKYTKNANDQIAIATIGDGQRIDPDGKANC